jgi:Ca2+/Na+ antiporter
LYICYLYTNRCSCHRVSVVLIFLICISMHVVPYLFGCWGGGLKVRYVALRCICLCALTIGKPTYYSCRSDNQTITNYTTHYDNSFAQSSFLHFDFAEIRVPVQYNLLRNVTHFLENLLCCVVLPSFLPTYTCALIVGYCVNFIKLVKSCYIS